MAGARALWRATGMKDGDFEKPIIAIANSFTQFVPGHVHLKDLGQLVAREIEEPVAWPRNSTPSRWTMASHGPRWHAVFAAFARPDRRQR